MRKIISNEEIEKKRKRNILIASIFMFVILVVSTIGYSFLSGSEYSSGLDADNEIQETGNGWIVPINGQKFFFTNPPEAVANISVDTSLTLSDYSGSTVYLVSDNSAVNTEIFSSLSRFASRIQEACYGACELNLPEKNCTDNLIIWTDALDNRVYQDGKCIFIDGDLRAVDAFLYKLLGYRAQ